jgi:class 3 adenylate cyclase/tetratricopeptide (TPR) repeat protein
MITCERCGNENPSGSRFCAACGGRLTGGGTPLGARKIVTALFCDIAGSTALGEGLDPELLHDLISRYFDDISATIERHGGTVQKFAGDAVLAAFGIPQLHEDDALRAVRAAAEIQARLPALAERVGVQLRLRTGINTGLVLSDLGRTLAMGDAVNVAARLEQAAAPGEILIGAETLRLVHDAVEVEPLEPLTLKGKSEPVPAFRLLRVDPAAPGLARRFDIPLVDRQRELQLVRAAWEAVLAASDCRLFTVLGTAGVGKSRLVAELFAQVGGAATTLSGSCLPYGEGITFWPVIEALMAAGDEAQPVIERLSRGGTATPEELFWEVRKLLESLARGRPLILHVDDLQWAEPMLLELLDHVVDLSDEAPILVLCTARPELLDEHPKWGSATLRRHSVLLTPLPSSDCETLLGHLDDQLSRDTRVRIIRTSEGNPLFLQEMALLAREHGAVDVPPSIQALLAARLEHLSAAERELLERGAVEGQVFHRSAVTALAGATDVESQLAALVRKDLIRPHPTVVPGDQAFRFRHLLIRDAAYERLPKATRADLHERYARWLERSAVEFVELDEIAGWHLEQAARNERELRRVVKTAVGRSAAEHLYAAGRRAGRRSDAAAARNLLERALDVVPEGDSFGTRIRVDLAEQLLEIGELDRADRLLISVEGDQDVAGAAALNRLEWQVHARPREAGKQIASRLPAMLQQLGHAGDERGIARAHMLAFWMHWTANQATLAAEEVRLAAEHALAAGDNGMRARALGWYVATLMYGPCDATAMARELDAIAREQPGPYLNAYVDQGRGEVRRLEGRFYDARRLTMRAMDGFTALGMVTVAAACAQSLARIELSAGDPTAARAALVRGDVILAEAGERLFRCTVQAMLGRAYEQLGARDEALAAVELAEKLSAPDDAINFAITHDVRARFALARGEPDAAERWSRSGVEHACRTDWLDVQAEARFGLARVLLACGGVTEAGTEADAARELFVAKGNRPGTGAALALLGEISARA